MKAPDKIYLVETTRIIDEWRRKPSQYAKNIEYIRKDALLKWAEDVKQGLIVEMGKYGVPNEQRIFAFQEFIDKINSL